MNFIKKNIELSVAIVFAIGTVFVFVSPSSYKFHPLNTENTFWGSDKVLILIFTIVSTLFLFIFPRIAKYVEEGTKTSREAEKIKSPIGGVDITAKAKEHIKSIVKEVLENPTEEDDQYINFDDELTEDEIKLQLIEEHTFDLQMSISHQIEKISRSGTTNLLIGLALTIFAMVMLVLVIYADDAPAYLFDETKNSAIRFFIHMIPRLSIVLFVEIFSFFFLNLYKRNAEEIKYFNNERTNIESKLIALKMAVVFGDKTTVNKTIESLYKTDRNSTIKKNETTIEIEKMKIDRSESQNSLDKLLKLSKVFNRTE